MSKIDKLTVEQERQLVQFRDQWLRIGQATGAANMEVVTPIITRFYQQIGKPVPVTIQLSSPLMANLAINLLSDQLSAQLSVQLHDQLSDQLRAQLRAQLSDQLRAQLSDQKMEYRPTYFWGAHDAFWIAFYQYPQRFLKADIYKDAQLALLDDWATLAEHSLWWYPFESICFVCDRPSVYHLDTQGRLHSEAEMSMRFTDGFGFYAIHGIRVPEKVILAPDTLTAADITDEPNTEIRRVMIDRMGREKFLRESAAQPVDVDDRFGTLYRTGRFETWLEVVNSTPEPDGSFKRYILSIDASIYRGAAGEKAQAAVASTWRYEDKTLVFKDWRDYRPTNES